MSRKILNLAPGLVAAALAFSGASANAGKHWDANHCELFVDKVGVERNSYTSKTISVYLKALPSRLDGKLVEVGFWARTSGTLSRGGTGVSNWGFRRLSNMPNANNYWVIHLTLSSDFNENSYEGAFFARTDKGTTYWAKSINGGNFIFDRNAFDVISSVAILTPSYYTASAPTQQERLKYYNPAKCY